MAAGRPRQSSVTTTAQLGAFLIPFWFTIRALGITLYLLCALSIASAARKAQHGQLRPPPPERHTLAPQKSKTVPFPIEYPSDFTTAPAYHYGQLSRAQCAAELQARRIPFKRETARGVDAPIRLTGPVHGILFRGEGTDEERAKSPHEIVDCRLVLALDDATATLAEHDIVEVRHYSMYRLPEGSWPRGRPAVHHTAGVAIDAGLFIKRDGSILNVDKHFHGAIGAKTCGPGAGPRPATAEATELRALLCTLAARQLFNLVLTPNYDRPHKNHFHLEVRPGKKWLLIH
jgi:hypothetical protein